MIICESLKVFMNELGSEIGITDYVDANKSRMPAIIHGTIGGNTSRLLKELGQIIISETPPDQIKELMDKYDLHVTQEVIDKVNELR